MDVVPGRSFSLEPSHRLRDGLHLPVLGSEVIVVEKAGRPLSGKDHEVSVLITTGVQKPGHPVPGRDRPRSRRGRSDGRVRAFLSTGRRSRPTGSWSVSAPANTEYLNWPQPDSAGTRERFRSTKTCRTSVPGIYAAGDVLARTMLFPWPSGSPDRAENAMGLDVKMDYTYAPWGIYTDPEVGSVGLTRSGLAPAEAKIVIGRCGYNDLVRSCWMRRSPAFSSSSSTWAALSDRRSCRRTGCRRDHPLRRRGGQNGARAEDLKDMVYNHPTLSKIRQGAADA